jgi:predicted SAM-dependent methyltransferase
VETGLAKKLNLGCGAFTMPGFINIDIQEPADVIGDFTRMEFSGVDEIVMSHVLEHISWQRTDEVLALVRSWMKRRALLTVEVPDMNAILQRGIYDQVAEIYIYGIQSAIGEFHLAGFTQEKLAYRMEAAAFTVQSSRAFLSETQGRVGLPCVEVIGKAR